MNSLKLATLNFGFRMFPFLTERNYISSDLDNSYDSERSINKFSCRTRIIVKAKRTMLRINAPKTKHTSETNIYEIIICQKDKKLKPIIEKRKTENDRIEKETV